MCIVEKEHFLIFFSDFHLMRKGRSIYSHNYECLNSWRSWNFRIKFELLSTQVRKMDFFHGIIMSKGLEKFKLSQIYNQNFD